MNMIELSATVAVEAMRNGDIKAEDSGDDVWSGGIASELGPVPERRHHAAYGR
jgi:hypothetical protein